MNQIMENKFVVVDWSDASSSIERSKKLPLKNFAVAEEVLLKVKGQLWTGVVNSIWGKVHSFLSYI